MLVIVDTGVANRYSIKNAFEFIGHDAKLSSDLEDIKQASRLVFPGVGSFSHGMESLRRKGIVETLNEEVVLKKKPVLGICLGMQMFAEKSEEGGDAQGLGWIPGVVRRISPKDPACKIPHIGFNTLIMKNKHALFDGLLDASDFYFVHGYYFDCPDEYVLATVDHGGEITSVVGKDNIVGCQFHPEKSQRTGLSLLANFLKI